MKILLVAYDNDSPISYFPLGLAYIASACRNAGHEVVIYNQDVYHWPEEHLTDQLDNERFDVVGIGVIGGYYQYRKLLKISEAINKSKQRPFYVMGGHGHHPNRSIFFKRPALMLLLWEKAKKSVADLLDAVSKDGDLSRVKGIAYIDESGKFRQTERRELISDLDGIPLPAWDLFPIEHYVLFAPYSIQKKGRSMIMVSGRGCNFKCNF